ncbi:MAG: radical SAM family heme chaperone HemW [Paracoccaceae bacterium]
MADDWQQGGFGLYVHWPFCEAKCPYCDFNSHVSRDIDQNIWRIAYLEELRKSANETPHRVLQSIFFGGGTPSLMNPDLIADIIAESRKLWPTANDLEVTLEANPSSVEAGRFAGYRDAGVNRVSLGVQALNDGDLQRLGRLHDVATARDALHIAQNTFDRVSFDLIYGRQNQTLEDWRSELSQAVGFGTDHMSLYQLTIEQGTAFGDRYNAGRLRGLPSDDLSADMYDLTQDICETNGLPAYEVSNHARDGAQSRHNLIYWRYGDYVGIGPGAHGRVTIDGTKHATEHVRMPASWLAGPRETVRTALDPNSCGEEMLLMGLRLAEGIDLNRFESMSGLRLDEKTLADLVDEGWVDVGRRITVRKQGLIVLNAILERLLTTARAS